MYWIDVHKADLCRWIEECDNDNNCEICQYNEICNALEVELMEG